MLTPYFRYMDGGPRFGMLPDKSDIIEPDEEIYGQPFIFISEKRLKLSSKNTIQIYSFLPNVI